MISLLMKTEYQIKRIQLLLRSAILAQENKNPHIVQCTCFFITKQTNMASFYYR